RLFRALVQPPVAEAEKYLVAIHRRRPPNGQVGRFAPDHLPTVRVEAEHLGALPAAANTAARVHTAAGQGRAGVDVKRPLELPAKFPACRVKAVQSVVARAEVDFTAGDARAR